MKNNTKRALGSILSVALLAVVITLTNLNEAHAQNVLTQEGGDFYDTSLCYKDGVHGVKCTTPMKLGPCINKVDCTY